MNTIRLLLCIAVPTLLTTSVQAQFETGQSFVSGGFSTNLGSYNNPDLESKGRNLDYNINASWGKFTKENRAVGWGISHGLSSNRLDRDVAARPSISSAGIGVDRFAEFYKPVFEKFALYIQPRVGLAYALNNTYSLQNNTTLSYKTRYHQLTLGASLSAGIAWRITPKWALYGNFAFTNPISISGGIGNTVDYPENGSQGEYTKSRSSFFEYKLSPTLFSGSVGLGFRYFYTRKNSDS